MKKPPPKSVKKQVKKIRPQLPPDSVLNNKNLIRIGVILLVTIIAYLPTFTCGFTNWDDNQYVTENQLVRNFTIANIITHFSQFYMGHYHPLTMISLMFDCLIGGDHAFIYHFTNILLHLFNTILVFWLVLRLTKNINITIVVAALFGIHSLHVESVTWISERKDVLYAFFYLAALVNYVRYIQLNKQKFYFFSLALFLCSLLSKAQGVSLAVIIIAVDYLLQRKPINTKLILEKVPFFILALIFGYISMQADKTNLYSEGMDKYPWIERLLLASYSLSFYFYKLILPVHLSNWYPYPYIAGTTMPGWLWIYPVVPVIYLLIILITIKKNRFISFSLLFFGFNIITMLQVFPIRDVIIADRYTYLSSIGIFLLLGYLFNYLFEKKKELFRYIRVIGLVYILILVIITNTRASVWKNSTELWGDTISKYPHIPIAHLNYGKAISDQGSQDEAIKQYDEAIRLDPKFSIAFNNRGVAKDNKGDKENAVLDYTKAISLNREYTLAYSNRAMAKRDLGDTTGAILDINTAISKSPKEAAFYRNRGLIRMSEADTFRGRNLTQSAEKKYTEVIIDMNNALKLDPKLFYAWTERGRAKHLLGDYYGAISDYNKAIKINDNYDEAYFNRAAAKMKINDVISACGDLKKAAGLGSDNAKQIYDKYCQ